MSIRMIGKSTMGPILKTETAIVAALFAATLVLGGLIGTGVAYAHVGWEYAKESTTTSKIVTHTQAGSVTFPKFQYDADHVVWADADYPDTREFTIHDTYYRNGKAPTSVKFGQTYIYASEGGETLVDHFFTCVPVNGVDKKKLTPWSADDLGSSKVAVNFEQWIWKINPFANCLTDDSLKHYESWQTS